MNLLLAEDDALLADALAAQLRSTGFTVDHAPNGAVAEFLLLKQAYDVAVLDIGLPMIDGLTVLKKVRMAKPELPVLLLTALDSLDSRIAGFQAGADDYLTKPFDFPELQWRLRALLRRSRPATPHTEMGRLRFDRDARRASVSGQMLELSPREWALLDLLLQQRDKVVGKEQIAAAWSLEGAESGSTEVYIHRLRRKLDGSGLAIRTVRGLGYLLETEPPV